MSVSEFYCSKVLMDVGCLLCICHAGAVREYPLLLSAYSLSQVCLLGLMKSKIDWPRTVNGGENRQLTVRATKLVRSGIGPVSSNLITIYLLTSSLFLGFLEIRTEGASRSLLAISRAKQYLCCNSKHTRA